MTPSKTTNTVMPPPGSFHIEYGIKFIILLNRHIFVQFFLSSEKMKAKKNSSLNDKAIQRGIKQQHLKKQNHTGAGTRNRTRDTRIFSPLLYRLSYPGTS